MESCIISYKTCEHHQTIREIIEKDVRLDEISDENLKNANGNNHQFELVPNTKIHQHDHHGVRLNYGKKRNPISCRKMIQGTTQSEHDHSQIGDMSL